MRFKINENLPVEAVPRHVEVVDALARKICRGLGLPPPPG
jgi:hypothetical protein